MKNLVLGMVLVLVVGMFGACASASGPYKPFSDFPGATIIGPIKTDYVAKGNSTTIKAINDAAYMALLEAARKEYQGNIDICDITWVIGKSAPGLYMYNFSASGKVISFGGNTRNNSTASGMEGALERAAEEVSESFSARSRIAIVYIAAEDRSQTDFIAGELEHILRRQGFVIIDRSELDRIRAEQRFGTTGEVDDSTAARIGNIAGASVVITGRVDGEGNLRRLRLRALETSSGQVVGTASERL